jgi:pimeloyl-ACP methyl ester carboxylesterase
VHLAEAGPPDAPALLLLHGWPQNNRLWRDVWPHFADDHRVLMPDLRGHGQTEAPGHGMDPDQFARDQIALLDALGIERVRMIGHDWGGYTGFLLAARHPDRVRAYLACNTPHPWLRVHPRLLKETWRLSYVVTLASPLGPTLLQRTDLVRRALLSETGGRGLTDADLDAFEGQWREPQRARATQLLYRSYLRRLGQVARGAPEPPLQVPAHLLFGRRDKAIAASMVEDFPGVEFVDAGHFVVDERPELVARRARDVFSREP